MTIVSYDIDSRKPEVEEPQTPKMATENSKDESGLPTRVGDLGSATCRIIASSSVVCNSSCPCCNRSLTDYKETVGNTRVMSYHDNLMNEAQSDTDSSSSYDDMDEQDSMMPGVLSDGIAFSITHNLVQGWVHKKGTGMDWLGSRAWKPRWAVLSLARISGHEVEVPLLQIYWSQSSPTPSTVIHLDSAVILPEDHNDSTKWNSFRFHIKHVKKSVDENSVQMTRTFSCPREGRDAWCEAINQALLEYEKEKAHARRNSSYMTLSPPRWRVGVSWAAGDAHPSAAKDILPLPVAPPTSPRSSTRSLRNLPRHEPSLVGEALLEQSMD